MKKNDIVIGTCQDYTYDGMGIVKVDGFLLFVQGLLVEEQAEIIVTKVKKHYGYGKIKQVLLKSKDRITPRCPIASRCGGCQLQHMSATHQAQMKKHQVETVMRHIAGIDVKVNDVLTMKEPWHYRNKAQIPCGQIQGEIITGFYRVHSNTMIDMETCAIQHERINQVLQVVKKELRKAQSAMNIRHLLVKYAMHTDELMVVFIVHHMRTFNKEMMITALTSQIPQVASIMCNINDRSDNVILGEKEILLYGRPYISDEIHGLRFRISMKSFYQVNPLQTEVLYQTALDFAQLKGNEEVIDLYCGVGTISMFLAKQAKHVTGIEIVPAAIANAKENAIRNGITNIDFICADAMTYAKQAREEQRKVDVVVVDPPRKGCDVQVLTGIAAMNPKLIVYVSCKVSTLARDIRILHDLGYETTKLQPVDMFPQTYGIECVAQLIKHERV